MTTGQPEQPDTNSAFAIEVRGLSHTYKPARKQRSSRKHPAPVNDAALDRVDLTVKPGEVLALLGPNGSGKSTLLRILATVLTVRSPHADAGSARIFGHDITLTPQRARQQLGVVFQHPALDLKLTALENLRIHGKLYGLTGEPLEHAARQALNTLGLADRINDFTESFSGGMRRRVEIAKALLTSPRLLLMDEASSGLDLAIQQAIWADVRRLVADTGLTVLLTTHLMHEAALADRVAVRSKGRVVAIDTPAALVAQVGGQVLQITPAPGITADDLRDQLLKHFTDRLNTSNTISQGGLLHIEHPQACAMIDAFARYLGQQASEFRLGWPTLADTYLKLTGQALDADPASTADL